MQKDFRVWQPFPEAKPPVDEQGRNDRLWLFNQYDAYDGARWGRCERLGLEDAELFEFFTQDGDTKFVTHWCEAAPEELPPPLPPELPVVVVERITRWCRIPGVWYGVTTCGKSINACYCAGILEVLRERADSSVAGMIFEKELRARTPDVLSYEELKAATRGKIEWPPDEPDASCEVSLEDWK